MNAGPGRAVPRDAEERFDVARAVADAVLFEGYVLYPYRASSRKNQVRWQFGVLAPDGAGDGETSRSRSECLVEAHDGCRLDVRVRFLHVRSRSGAGPDWDEAEVREVDTSAVLDTLGEEREVPFEIPGDLRTEGEVTRRAEPLSGTVRIAAERFPGPYGLVKLRVVVQNTTDPGTDTGGRAEMLRHSLVSAHVLLAVHDGEFVSLLEPPEWARAAAESCENQHVWPVLVGDPDRRDVLLSSPIILYDHPSVAPESPGELYDATEIDEILTLRTMALTEQEKQEARATDDRAAAIIDRVEDMPPEMLDRLHGTIRYLQDVTGDGPPGNGSGNGSAHRSGNGAGTDPDPKPWWDPGSDASVSPETDSVPVTGGVVSRGSKVRLRPSPRSTDAQDMFLAGRPATVEAVFFDVDGASHVGVTVDDDPAAELNQWVGRFRYYAPDEVELEAP